MCVEPDPSESPGTDPFIRERARQQAAVAGLGMKALSGVGLTELLEETVRVVSQILEVKFAEILQFLPDDMSVRQVAGVGWKKGSVGRTLGRLEIDSQAAFALVSQRPVVSGDLEPERTFLPTPLHREHGVVSGISVVIAGEGKAWGILGAHDTRQRHFSADDVNFFQSVANVIAEAAHRHRQEEALRASEERFRSVAKATNDAIWDWDLETDGLWWSDGFSRLFGFSHGEIEPHIGSWTSHIHPDDRDEVTGTLESAVAGGRESWAAEYRFVRKDGRIAYVLDRGHILRSSAGRAIRVVGGMTDLTHRRETESALKESEARFRELAENIHEVFYNLDPRNGILLYISPAYESIWGRSRESLYANPRSFMDDVHPEDRHLVETIRPRALAGQSTELEYRLMRPDGRMFWIRDRSYPVFDEQGIVKRVVGTASDITDQKRSLLEVARTNRALKMLSSCNENLIRATDERQLLNDTCRLAVEIGGYVMAWVGYALDDAARSIKPMAHDGAGGGYLSEIRLTWDETVPSGAGPGGRTIRTGEPQVCENIDDPACGFHFREAAHMRGFRGVVCLPLREGDRTFGLLALLTGEGHPVSAEEVRLLQELADDLAFGICHIRAQQERLRMETAVQKMAATVSAASGSGFFEQLARNMAEAVGARGGFVVKLLAEPPGIGRTLAAVVDGKAMAPMQYRIDSSPCANVLQAEDFVMTANLSDRFPHSPAALLKGQAYAGRRLVNSSGEVVGLVSVLFSDRLDHAGLIRPTLQVFADRAAAELDMEQADLLIREQASLLDKARDAILVRSLDHRITFWNKSAERLYGWTAEEVAGRSVRELLYRDQRTYDEAYRAVLRDGEWVGELEQVSRSGRAIVVEGRWTLLRDAGDRPKSILSINTDITEQKLLQQQFLRSQRLESIGTLAGGIAHDLNNVLAPISMSIELLHMKLPDERSRELLETIASCARRGSEMIAQVLSFGRGVEGRRMEIRIRDLFADIEKILRDTFPKNLEIITDCPPDLWTILGDPTQLHQVLLNLCVNARDAMQDGGGMTVRAMNIPSNSASASQGLGSPGGPHVCIEVSDTGSGIPADLLDKVFDPFFTTKRTGEGTGLGLSTSLAIIKSHHGFMHVSNLPGSGARFRFCLPAVEKPGQVIGVTRSAPPPRGNGQTVLVADDEKSLREVARQTLEEFNYRVLIAEDGMQALKMYEQHRGEISVILTDIMMPRMDGHTLIRKLRALDPALPVIATSGFDINPEEKTATGDGADRFLAKPYTASSLLRALAEVLSGKG